jgi:hypothetical protein
MGNIWKYEMEVSINGGIPKMDGGVILTDVFLGGIGSLHGRILEYQRRHSNLRSVGISYGKHVQEMMTVVSSGLFSKFRNHRLLSSMTLEFVLAVWRSAQ